MKKFISFVVASAMVLSLVPATAFAASEAKVSRVVTAEDGTKLTEDGTGSKEAVAPTLTLKVDGNFKGEGSQDFRLKLTNAEWLDDIDGHEGIIAGEDKTAVDEAIEKVDDAEKALAGAEKALADAKKALADALEANPEADVETEEAAVKEAAVKVKGAKDALKALDEAYFKIEKSTSSTVVVHVVGGAPLADTQELDIPMLTELTGGVATVAVDPRDSEFTAETKTFAKTSDGSTEFYVDSKKDFYDGEAINEVYLDEVVAGTLEAGKTLEVKVSGGFKIKSLDEVKVVEGDGIKVDKTQVTFKGNTMYIPLTGVSSTKVVSILVKGIVLEEDGADFGQVAKLSINGAGASKQTIEVGTMVDFGVVLEVEKKDLPVIYAGSLADKADNDNETLKVTLKEVVEDSLLANRKITFKLPEGVEFVAGSFDTSKEENWVGKVQDVLNQAIDEDAENEITISADQLATETGKAKVEFTFQIQAAPDFAGDVDLTVTGPGVANEELKVTVAKVVAPIAVKADVNEVKIDYRNVVVGDIVVTEAEAGLWDKGQTIVLEVEEMQFEDGIKAKVTKGDMSLEKLDGDNVKVDKNGRITLAVKNVSVDTPAEITISGIQLYLNRSLPAGDYKLNAVMADAKTDVWFADYDKDGDDKTGLFDTDSVTLLKDYVKVVTAGRDQDDATFTTQIVVPVGSDTIKAGTKEIKVDAPAYINKDGYTMLPVRAVVEALNGLAAIRWDDATKTVTITFGQRVISMTVGSKAMNINGVPTQLLAVPEITNSRVFLPLRDLGYALGLKDDKIVWDAATATATLN